MREILLSITLALLGCSAPADGPALINPDVPAQPEDAIRLVSSPFEVGPGEETFQCMRLAVDVTEDIFINASTTYQSEGGHHIVFYYVEGTVPLEDEPHECNELDMNNIRFLGTGIANGTGSFLPPGIAFRVPVGARLYAQSHYINLTDQPVEVQDVVDLTTLPPDEVEVLAGAFAQVDLGFELPPQQETTRTLECAFPFDGITVPWMLPHMHEWGSHYKIELARGETTQVLYESPWSEALRSDAPYVDVGEIEVGRDDRLRTHCTWINTESEPLLFPREMCATFMPFYPSTDGAFFACNEDGDVFEI